MERSVGKLIAQFDRLSDLIETKSYLFESGEVAPIEHRDNFTANVCVTLEHLNWMCEKCSWELDVYKLTDKDIKMMHRWLGFVQGTLCMLGVTTIDQERDATRDQF